LSFVRLGEWVMRKSTYTEMNMVFQTLGRKRELVTLKQSQACNPSSEKLRQEDCEFKTSLGYRARPCLKQKNYSTSEKILPMWGQK
jgi:hypothetical protein